MDTISEAYHKEVTYERLEFSAKKDDGSEWKGAGWSWEMKDGELQFPKHPAGLENLLKCVLPDFITARDWDDEQQCFVTESQAFGNGRIVTWTNRIFVPKVIRCCENGNVSLSSGLTNTCRACGADYNGFGQRLAPREQWGEETGEHWSDLMDYGNNNQSGGFVTGGR